MMGTVLPPAKPIVPQIETHHIVQNIVGTVLHPVGVVRHLLTLRTRMLRRVDVVRVVQSIKEEMRVASGGEDELHPVDTHLVETSAPDHLYHELGDIQGRL